MPRKRKPTWHKTGRWSFTLNLPGGKRKTVYADRSIGATSKGRAREWMEATLEALEERRVAGGDFSVDDLRLAYLTWAEGRVGENAMAQATFDGHRKQLRQVCRAVVEHRAFGERIARDLKAADVEKLQKAWKGKGATTIRNRLSSLQAVLNWAAQPRSDRAVERLLSINPVAKMELPQAPAAEGRYSASSEVAAFLAFVDERAAAAKGHSARFERMTALLIRVVAETGCRPGEMCRFEWRHFDHARGLVIFPPPEHKTGRKTGRSRVIVLTGDLPARIEALRADPDRHPTHVFTHRTHSHGGRKAEAAERRAGWPWDSSKLSRRFKALKDAAIGAGRIEGGSGVDRLHAYKLRHSRITNLIQQGTAISDVAGLVGNSSKVIEQVYLHHQPDHLRRISDQAERNEAEYRERHGTT